MIKNDTINPIKYSNPIAPSSETIAATDIQACDYKKNHRDENKYNVSHAIAPKIDSDAKISSQAQCQVLNREPIGLSIRLA